MILAADIGGTNARLALFSEDGAAILDAETYATAAVPGAAEIASSFLGERSRRVTSACFAVAGPVRGGRSESINVGWPVDRRELAVAIGVEAVAVVNDLEANARGIGLLRSRDLAVVNAGRPEAGGNRAVVSAGTGLGEAGLVWAHGRCHVVAGEGGHTGFAPRSELEVRLYRFLAAEHDHVSYERVCSGGGLVNVYRFLEACDPDGRRRRVATPRPEAILAEAGADRTSVAARALALFASIYGARAGNVALTFLATGGIYLGGGIAPTIVDTLTSGVFMRAFRAKGRLSALLDSVPVYVVLNDRAALLGAASIAAELARGTGRAAAAVRTRPRPRGGR